MIPKTHVIFSNKSYKKKKKLYVEPIIYLLLAIYNITEPIAAYHQAMFNILESFAFYFVIVSKTRFSIYNILNTGILILPFVIFISYYIFINFQLLFYYTFFFQSSSFKSLSEIRSSKNCIITDQDTQYHERHISIVKF